MEAPVHRPNRDKRIMDNGRECGRAEMLMEQGSVVQKVYNSIHRINHYKGEFYFFLNVDLFGGLRYVH